MDEDSAYAAWHGRLAASPDDKDAWLTQATATTREWQRRLDLGSLRPFFWLCRSADIATARTTSPDAVRNVLGLSHLQRNRRVFEASFRAGDLPAVHRPTVLDALDGPTFFPVDDAG
jgi:hypothetical protein